MPKVDNITLDYTRLAIIGSPGSGKSTIGSIIANRLDRPCIHLDTKMWQANWQLPTEQERTSIHDQLISGDRWIIEGSWFGHIADRLDRATAVIWLDYSTGVCMRGVLGRCLSNRGRQTPYLADGCVEKIDWNFLCYTMRYRRQRRPDLLNMLNLHQDKLLTFTTRRQASAWVDRLGQ